MKTKRRQPHSTIQPCEKFRYLKKFFAEILCVKPSLSTEEWQRLEVRKSPQSIRADARREGIL